MFHILTWNSPARTNKVSSGSSILATIKAIIKVIMIMINILIIMITTIMIMITTIIIMITIKTIVIPITKIKDFNLSGLSRRMLKLIASW